MATNKKNDKLNEGVDYAFVKAMLDAVKQMNPDVTASSLEDLFEKVSGGEIRYISADQQAAGITARMDHKTGLVRYTLNDVDRTVVTIDFPRMFVRKPKSAPKPKATGSAAKTGSDGPKAKGKKPEKKPEPKTHGKSSKPEQPKVRVQRGAAANAGGRSQPAKQLTTEEYRHLLIKEFWKVNTPDEVKDGGVWSLRVPEVTENGDKWELVEKAGICWTFKNRNHPNVVIDLMIGDVKYLNYRNGYCGPDKKTQYFDGTTA